ncbi:MAG: 50S ribosomal protein L15 [Oligoflexia bacterium]|nr:50S ribosomal protein L15 [Oligoflexia bacterium]
MTMSLTNIRSPRGAHKNTKRLGRGPGSGQGCQAGKGHKGHKARAGGGVRIGFESALPLYMRLPKIRKFTNEAFKNKFAVMNLSDIDKKFNQNDTVTKEKIIETKMLKGAKKNLKVKVIMKEKDFLCKKMIFKEIDSFSKKARESILKSGGTIL